MVKSRIPASALVSPMIRDDLPKGVFARITFGLKLMVMIKITFEKGQPRLGCFLPAQGKPLLSDLKNESAADVGSGELLAGPGVNFFPPRDFGD